MTYYFKWKNHTIAERIEHLSTKHTSFALEYVQQLTKGQDPVNEFLTAVSELLWLTGIAIENPEIAFDDRMESLRTALLRTYYAWDQLPTNHLPDNKACSHAKRFARNWSHLVIEIAESVVYEFDAVRGNPEDWLNSYSQRTDFDFEFLRGNLGIEWHRDDGLPSFLGLRVNEVERLVTQAGEKEKSASFERKDKAWLLFHALFKAEKKGLSRDDLMKSIWKGKIVNDSNLDTQKGKANEVLSPLRIAINADNYGVWTIENV
jgi:hypothetical protein